MRLRGCGALGLSLILYYKFGVERMDEWGCFRAKAEDWDEIARQLNACGTIVFPYSTDQMGCLVLLISKDFTKLGVMPYGGNPSGRLYVGVYGTGLTHLGTGLEDNHFMYLKEKLGVDEFDAQAISQLMRELSIRLNRPN